MSSQIEKLFRVRDGGDSPQETLRERISLSPSIANLLLPHLGGRSSPKRSHNHRAKSDRTRITPDSLPENPRESI